MNVLAYLVEKGFLTKEPAVDLIGVDLEGIRGDSNLLNEVP